jgi:hypothetical protein
MATQVISARGGCTLYEIEDHLAALVNSVAFADEPAAHEVILDEIGQAVRRAKEKRDAVVGFLRHCAAQERFAEAEIERIQKRSAFIASVRVELEQYLIQIVERFAVPAGTDDASEEEQESELESRRKPVAVAQESLSELRRSLTGTR